MYPHKLAITLNIILICFVSNSPIRAQQRTAKGGRVAVVVDERLSALRSTPELSGRLVRRIGRGRLVAVRGRTKSAAGVIFYRVSISSRTHGWIQREAVVSAAQPDDDKKLASLVLRSSDFDRIARARIFLDVFKHSSLRPRVLLLFGDAAEEAAVKLSRDAVRRLSLPGETGSAPEFSYYLNYTGLDRYNRQGVRFIFDRTQKQFHYDGAAWRELIKRYPTSPEAASASVRLKELRRFSWIGRR